MTSMPPSALRIASRWPCEAESERGDLVQAYHRRITGPDPDVALARGRAAAAAGRPWLAAPTTVT